MDINRIKFNKNSSYIMNGNHAYGIGSGALCPYFLSTPSLIQKVLRYMSEVIISRRGYGEAGRVAGNMLHVEFVTASTQWTVPFAKDQKFDVMVFGGGGGGNTTTWAGGGGGNMNMRNGIVLTRGSKIAISIGGGGSVSGTGGTTSFGSWVSATGGSAASDTNGGAGGSGGGAGIKKVGWCNYFVGNGGIAYYGGGGGGRNGGSGGLYGGGGGSCTNGSVWECGKPGIGGQYGGNGGWRNNLAGGGDLRNNASLVEAINGTSTLYYSNLYNDGSSNIFSGVGSKGATGGWWAGGTRGFNDCVTRMAYGGGGGYGGNGGAGSSVSFYGSGKASPEASVTAGIGGGGGGYGGHGASGDSYQYWFEWDDDGEWDKYNKPGRGGGGGGWGGNALGSGGGGYGPSGYGRGGDGSGNGIGVGGICIIRYLD